MSNKYGLGYLPDDAGVQYPSHHGLVAAGPPTLDTADHIPYRSGTVYQNGVGECVAAWLKRAVQLWQSLNGFESDDMISATFSYGVGRALAYAGVNPDDAPPLVDLGSKPSLVLLGAQQVGVVLEDHYPDPGSATWDTSSVNARPTPDALVKAYDFRGLEFSDVIRGAWGFKESIRACMVRRQPVGFSLFVDSRIFDNTGEIVTAIDRNDPDGGGHMVGVLDASREDFVVLDNWWSLPGVSDWGLLLGNEHGPAGAWRMAWPLLERSIIQCLAVKAVPFLARKVA
jgi:hypothetical protein